MPAKLRLEGLDDRSLTTFNQVTRSNMLSHQNVLQLLPQLHNSLHGEGSNTEKQYSVNPISTYQETIQGLGDEIINQFITKHDSDKFSTPVCIGHLSGQGTIEGASHWFTLHFRKVKVGDKTEIQLFTADSLDPQGAGHYDAMLQPLLNYIRNFGESDIARLGLNEEIKPRFQEFVRQKSAGLMTVSNKAQGLKCERQSGLTCADHATWNAVALNSLDVVNASTESPKQLKRQDGTAYTLNTFLQEGRQRFLQANFVEATTRDTVRQKKEAASKKQENKDKDIDPNKDQANLKENLESYLKVIITSDLESIEKLQHLKEVEEKLSNDKDLADDEKATLKSELNIEKYHEKAIINIIEGAIEKLASQNKFNEISFLLTLSPTKMANHLDTNLLNNLILLTQTQTATVESLTVQFGNFKLDNPVISKKPKEEGPLNPGNKNNGNNGNGEGNKHPKGNHTPPTPSPTQQLQASQLDRKKTLKAVFEAIKDLSDEDAKTSAIKTTLAKQSTQAFLNPPVYSGLGARTNLSYDEGKKIHIFKITEIFPGSALEGKAQIGDIIEVNLDDSSEQGRKNATQKLRDLATCDKISEDIKFCDSNGKQQDPQPTSLKSQNPFILHEKCSDLQKFNQDLQKEASPAILRL